MQYYFNNASELKDRLSGKKVFLVHGKSFEGGPAETLFSQCLTEDFTGFHPNPLYEEICDGVEAYRRFAPELIVAVGGGSAIDTAKCIKLFGSMEPGGDYLKQEKRPCKVPMLAIPSTAGSGSESTPSAVLYADGSKVSVSSKDLLPEYVFLMPELLYSLPVYQKKCTLMDALCQAIESWWSVRSTEESIACSRKAVEIILRRWEAYLKIQSDADRSKSNDLILAEVMRGSNYAGRAIGITATTAAHAMSYKLTSNFGIPHGHAVALCMSQVWEQIERTLEEEGPVTDPRGADHLCASMREIDSLIARQEFEEIRKQMELFFPCREHKIGPKESVSLLNELTDSVNEERLKNCPVRFSRTAIFEMYERVMEFR